MEVEARQALAADRAAVVELAREGRRSIAGSRGAAQWLHRDALQEPVDENLDTLLDGSAGTVIVGTIDGIVVGIMLVRIESVPEGEAGDVMEVFVIEEMRGVGVGEAMMGAVTDWARVRGLRGLGGRALPGDRAMKNFFERHGLVARSIEVYRSLDAEIPKR